jgi:uncharacterized membrane protein (DUF2068 family)
MTEPIPDVAPWEDAALRTIAIYKFIKAGLILTLGLMLLHLVHHDVVQVLRQYIFEPLHLESDFDADSENHFLKWLFLTAASLTPHSIMWSSWASFFYAAVFAVEGTGLFLKKHWAEYFVIFVTGTFLPFEIWTLYHHPAWWKILLILGNLLIIVYLVHRLLLDAKRKAQAKTAELLEAVPAEKSAVVSNV